MKRAQSRFEFWDSIFERAIEGAERAEEHNSVKSVTERAAQIADAALKARDDRAEFLRQHKPAPEVEAEGPEEAPVPN